MKNKITRTGRIGVAIVTVAFGISLVGATPAFAAAPVPPEPTGVCWLDLSDNSYECFADNAAFHRAVLADTGAPLLQGGETAPAARTAGVAAPAATYLLGTMYVDQGWSGATLQITTQYSNLCATHSYTGNSMPAGWNNVVSSFKSYGTCKTSVASNINMTGTITAPQVNLAWMGVMNDDTSAYRISV